MDKTSQGAKSMLAANRRPTPDRTTTMEQPNQMFRSISSIRNHNKPQQQLQQQQAAAATTLRRQLGNKDLIIRMLAEVFQVNQTQDGQMRWEQVSSSLVPVSLYSRSTSRWLNYLISASSSMSAAVSDHSGCAMSPDSRDFLLLLQQFHQQQQNKSKQVAAQQLMHESSMDQYENCVVFQVVAHDYLDGQCRKILNVKLAQPGTRLGQASEYFVYWKEQQPHQQQQQQQQFVMQPPTQQLISGRRRFVAVPSSSTTPLRYSANQHQHITWGLNFASVNDAKLFYDICSLNLVDLDFNSEYLKQFIRTEDRENYNQFNVCHQQQQQQQQHIPRMPTCENFATNQQQQQRLNKVISKQLASNNFNCQNQDQQQQQEALIKPRQSGLRDARRQRMLEEFNSFRCQTCREQQSYLEGNQSVGRRMRERVDCPVHAKVMRTRSKSTTRQPTNDSNLEEQTDREDRAQSRRTRSFSTPASPERDPECPVHSQKGSKQVVGSHHPKCLNYIRHKQQMQQQHQESFGQSIDSERTASRQARSRVASRNGEFDETMAPPVPQHQSSVSSAQSLHSKRAPKARYMGHVAQRGRMQRRHQQQTREGSKESRDSTVLDRVVVSEGEQAGVAPPSGCPEWRHSMPAEAITRTTTPATTTTTTAAIDHQPKEDLERTTKFITSRAAQRRSTACEAGSSNFGGGDDDGGSPTHRNARLARAQYANSKNMKEFLSLDAAGTQLPSSQLQQLQHHQRQPQQLVPRQRPKQQEMGPTTREQQTKANSSVGMMSSGLERAVADWQQQTVGTTTEDLPLDPATRKRMFRLTSEEAISERTEPRSSSTQTTVAENKRAVSLGPSTSEIALKRQQLGAGARARSDASRRRSLERTMCVDLDLDTNNNGNGNGNDNCNNGTLKNQPTATLPTMSSFRKSYRLSPLPQSSKSSPSVCEAGAESSFQPVDSFGGQQQNQASSTPDVRQQQQQQQQSPPPTGNCCSVTNNDEIVGFNQCHQQAASYPVQNRATGFYAVPLVSCACQRPTRHYDPDFGSRDLPSSNSRMRQSRSCPNSLRRKRTSHQPRGYIPNAADQYQLETATQNMNTTTAGTRLQQRLHLNDCQCQICPRISANQPTSRPSSALSELVQLQHQHQHRRQNFCSLCRGSDFVCSDTRTTGSCARTGSNWPAASDGFVAPGPTCMNNVSGGGEPVQVYSDSGIASTQARTRYCLAGGLQAARRQQQQQAGYYRPCSSLSSRSPLHFGLYDSDLEDEADAGAETGDAVGDDDHEDEPPTRYQCQAAAAAAASDPTCPLHQHAAAAACCALESAHYNHNHHHHHHHQQERPHLPFRPVSGYDQTMARSSLKCRQRARSQPPSQRLQQQLNDSSQANLDNSDAFYLNRSMENVQKLIREVQNELDVLRPFASGLRSSSAAPEDDLHKRQQQQDTLASKSSLQPYVHFDWRLIAERGLRCYGHFHRPRNEAKTVASCELSFLQKVSHDEEARQREANKSGVIGKVSLSSATRPAGQFKCVGAIRKAGFLSVKKWILKRKQSIELARKQGWKRYWVCLRGTTLLFYSVVDRKDLSEEEVPNRTSLLSWIQSNCAKHQHSEHLGGVTSGESLSQCYIEKEPRHLIIIEGAIAQPIPEHPKRDFVFCLSTTFGDAYLFQSACQMESDNWISAIHNACAASIARDLTRDEATKLFENKIRHLEIEAEKKIFLRQRLESRLTSMSSISHIAVDDSDYPQRGEDERDKENVKRRSTMRSLLFKLNQQLLSLDTYIEQVHCEIYQLRCYIASCSSQRAFYQQHWLQTSGASSGEGWPKHSSLMAPAADLPHPKALLMYVSKPTKLILIKLGVFTVSSFHAYIHARQGSAETILQRIQRPSSSEQSPTVELRVRSRSLSEQMLSNRLLENVQLENETEKLIDMSDFKLITVRLSKSLHERIKSTCADGGCTTNVKPKDSKDIDSDESFLVEDSGENILISTRVHPSSNTLKMIKQLLNVIEPNLPEMEFLNYYLRFDIQSSDSGTDKDNRGDSEAGGGGGSGEKYVVKRTETASDWTPRGRHCLELVEKIVFRLDLARRQVEEESAPFGISIGVQLFEGKLESLLNVQCSYIEWGSVADKAGLRDDDELLMINGVPVMDLDMMFVESLIQDDARLRLVVRSSREEFPTGAVCLDLRDWRSSPGSNNDDENESKASNRDEVNKLQQGLISSGQTQVISDEYISSLVCPPPPNKSSAFLHVDPSLLRQKSDITESQVKRIHLDNQPDQAEESKSMANEHQTQRDLVEGANSMARAKSQHNIDSSLMGDELVSADSAPVATRNYLPTTELVPSEAQANNRASLNLANQLVRRTEQLTRLLGKAVTDNGQASVNRNLDKVDGVRMDANETVEARTRMDASSNAAERLRKSILELIETEFAYIRHLETISEHYMSPLEEMSFLSINDLSQLNEIVAKLTAFQREFFEKLAQGAAEGSSAQSQDEYEALNQIVRRLDSIESTSDLIPILGSISQTFLDEAEKFKIYSAYCSTYSRLQKLLHPKRALKVNSSSVIASPAALDTFLLSSTSQLTLQGGTSGNMGPAGGGSSRDFLKPLGSFMGANTGNQSHQSAVSSAPTNESKTQLKQLNEFLGHLDSSSSSVSLSLPKSSGSGNQKSTSSTAGNNKPNNKQAAPTGFQKSAHQQSFESYLIKPIQRIVKYPMLLNSIALSVGQVYAENKEIGQNLQKAVKQMESITSHVNDTQRIHDEFGTAFELIVRQFLKRIQESNSHKPAPGPHQPAIGLSIDQLLYHDQVDWLNILEFNPKAKRPNNLTCHLFVFSSCVVFICKELVHKSGDIAKRMAPSSLSSFATQTNRPSRPEQPDTAEIIRYQSLIAVSEVQVRSVPTTQSLFKSRFKHQWELFRCSSVNSNSSLLSKSSKRSFVAGANDGKVYLLASASNDARNTFLRKIRHIIRESVRNMSLPISRSPSSKSLSPKKPSSSSNTNTNESCSQSVSLSPVVNGRNYNMEDNGNSFIKGIEVNN